MRHDIVMSGNENPLNSGPDESTFIFTGPIFPAGQVAGPNDTLRIMAQGGPTVEKTIALTGKEKFEHMLLYCLNLLHQGGSDICAFYLEDFDDCDEHTLRVVQGLIGRSGYVTRDFLDHPGKRYKGFWAWRPK